jgi:hypothetical protein
MKKRILFAAQSLLLILFVSSLLAAVFELSGDANPLSRFDHNIATHNRIEAFDPSLSRLNSLKKFEQYCDSMYAQKAFGGNPIEFEKTYTDVVSRAVRNRFFHGYSYYGYGNNYVAKVVSKLTIPGLSALVIPDEILQHPYAACSQQSIVMMEVLKDKGFTTRKIAFQGKKFGGHFAFEVFYDGTWHFNDPNMEPDNATLNMHGRPGIDFLVRNPEVLLKAYYRYGSEQIMDIFPTYSYGAVNEFPAPKALIFQNLTRMLSYTIWLPFLIGFIVVRRKYRRFGKKGFTGNHLTPVIGVRPDAAPVYFPGYNVHRS